MEDRAIPIELEASSPTAHWAAGAGRALITGRLHLARTGDRDLQDEILRTLFAVLEEEGVTFQLRHHLRS